MRAYRRVALAALARQGPARAGEHQALNSQRRLHGRVAAPGAVRWEYVGAGNLGAAGAQVRPPLVLAVLAQVRGKALDDRLPRTLGGRADFLPPMVALWTIRPIGMGPTPVVGPPLVAALVAHAVLDDNLGVVRVWA